MGLSVFADEPIYVCAVTSIHFCETQAHGAIDLSHPPRSSPSLTRRCGVFEFIATPVDSRAKPPGDGLSTSHGKWVVSIRACFSRNQ
jgi:hypothetical protein